MKQATTVSQQIEILKDRGMFIDLSEEKAKEILGDIGYFRLGFYCFPFEISYPNKNDRTHQYKPGSKFSDVVDLYHLDFDLRNILLKYLFRIEINFRTKIVYHVSNQYISNNIWFVDPNVMNEAFIKKFDLELYTDNFKKNQVIKNHHRKYVDDEYAPAWKTLEYFTFGAILKVFSNLKNNSLKQSISMKYGILNVSTFENYFRVIVELRNLCAHGSILFDHKLAMPLRNGIAFKINNQNKNTLFSAIRILHYLIDQIAENRAEDMMNEINKLFDDYSKSMKIKDIIDYSMGRKKI